MTIKEILSGENENIEYKADLSPKSESYMRTIVAYANANGGRLVFGMENNTWRVAGFTREEIFQKMDAVTNAIYDSCEPKITPSVEMQEVDGKYIIVVDIPAGMQRPYCIKSQGIIEGVYLRVSGTTRKAAIYQIQEMTLAARNRSFDSERVERELSVDEMNAFCSRLYHRAEQLCENEGARGALKRIGISQLISFKAVHEMNGKYYATNGYQLLDGRLDEYPDAVVQCAVFKGTVRDIFITRKEFSGCIDEEVESAYEFVLEHIDLGARIDGLIRQDIYELPIRAIREMITNAVCHRSYLCPGKVQVALFDDRLEVTSPGMLDKDLTVEKMRAGISKIRNGVIAKIFAYMNMVEAWGTGIPKILEEAKNYGLKEPELQDMGSDFRINLYRKKAETDIYGVVDPRSVIVIKEDCSVYAFSEDSAKKGNDDIQTCIDDAGCIKAGTKVSSGIKIGMDGTKVGSGIIIGMDGTKAGTDGTKVNSGIKIGMDGTEAGTDDTKVRCGIKIGMDGTKAGTDGTEIGADSTKTDTSGTKDVVIDTKVSAADISENTDGTNSSADGIFGSSKMADEEKLLSVIREDGTITQKQMSNKTGLSLRTVKRMTVELQKTGKIVRVGNSRSGRWQVLIR